MFKKMRELSKEVEYQRAVIVRKIAEKISEDVGSDIDCDKLTDIIYDDDDFTELAGIFEYDFGADIKDVLEGEVSAEVMEIIGGR
ncbi:MAG: hypothetical protein ACRDCW_02520 [Sarcina sp.]